VKQRIELAQLNELTDEQKEKLREWWKPKRHDVFYSYYAKTEAVYQPGMFIGGRPPKSNKCIPLLSIGQMIEILGDNLTSIINGDSGYQICTATEFRGLQGSVAGEVYGELADALWPAVKPIL